MFHTIELQLKYESAEKYLSKYSCEIMTEFQTIIIDVFLIRFMNLKNMVYDMKLKEIVLLDIMFSFIV